MPATVHIVHRFPRVRLALGIALVLTCMSPVGFGVLHGFNASYGAASELTQGVDRNYFGAFANRGPYGVRTASKRMPSGAGGFGLSVIHDSMAATVLIRPGYFPEDSR